MLRPDEASGKTQALIHDHAGLLLRFGLPEEERDYSLEADAEVVIQVGEDIMTGSARTVADEDRDRVWKIMTDIWPDYDEYATKTDRKIPLVAISV